MYLFKYAFLETYFIKWESQCIMTHLIIYVICEWIYLFPAHLSIFWGVAVLMVCMQDDCVWVLYVVSMILTPSLLPPCSPHQPCTPAAPIVPSPCMMRPIWPCTTSASPPCPSWLTACWSSTSALRCFWTMPPSTGTIWEWLHDCCWLTFAVCFRNVENFCFRCFFKVIHDYNDNKKM